MTRARSLEKPVIPFLVRGIATIPECTDRSYGDMDMTDLGAVPGDRCGNAYAINARTQVVGTNGHCHGFVDAFLWERGSIYNLNDLVAGPAPLHLVVALYITDDGLIAGTGVPPGVSV
jgi:probable HAF family extracellular repeat protein